MNWQLLKYKVLRFVCFHHLEWMSDEAYLKMMYRIKMGKSLDLDNPKTFNEKLQWLKIHDRKPEYTTMVDKYAVKKYVTDIIGEEYIIPTLGKWDRFDDIDFDQLPDQFVLKCNHDSGSFVIVKDKAKFDKRVAKKKLEARLKRNFYWIYREWPYKHVKPCIIAEKYLEDDTTEEGGLIDYKLLCFNGKVKDVLVVHDRFTGKPRYCHYDTEWNVNRINQRMVNLPHDYREERPCFIDKMVEIAEKISKNIPHVRIDLYWCDNRVYFGECTFYQQAGFVVGFTKEADRLLGSYITVI